MKKGESFLINQPIVPINEEELLYFNLVWYVYESRKNHRLIITISATGTSTTTASLTTSPDIRKIKQHSPCNNIQKLRILSLSLFRIKTNKMSQLNINKRAGTIMEHISCPSFWSVRSTMLRIFSLPWLQSTSSSRVYYNDVSMVPSLGVKWR